MKISIITINYNNSHFLKQTIQSVFDQSYKNFEYIIIDGGSKDKSLEIIKSFEKKRNDIDYKWVSESDDGISDAFNKGIKLATGEIIGLLNSSDLYHEKTLERVANNYSTTNFDLFYGDTIKIDDEGKEYSYTKAKTWKKIFFGLTFMHSACFIPKRIYDEIGYFNKEYKIAMDIDILLSLRTIIIFVWR